MGVTLKRTEKAEQTAIKRMLRTLGIAYYDTSQPFRAAITPGVPDLICFCPRVGLFFIECKRPGGKPTPPQVEFGDYCERAGVPWIVGGTTEVAEFLGIT